MLRALGLVLALILALSTPSRCFFVSGIVRAASARTVREVGWLCWHPIP